MRRRTDEGERELGVELAVRGHGTVAQDRRRETRLAILEARERVEELHRGAGRTKDVDITGRGRRRSTEAIDHERHRVRVVARRVEPEPRREAGSHLVVRATLAHTVDHGCDPLTGERAVRAGEVIGLEMRRRREHDVGVEGGVREHLVVHDREQVVACQALEHEPLPGRGDSRVRSLHEQHPHPGELGAEMVHVHLAPATRGSSVQRELVRATEARHHPAAEHPELAGEDREPEHRAIRRATVAVALETPPDAQERRMDRGELFSERDDIVCVDTGDLGGSRGRPLRRACDELVRARRVRVHERPIDEPLAIEMPHHAEHERHIRAGPQREVTVGSPRHRGATGIDHDQPGSRGTRLLHQRREVDVRDRGVRAPHHDELAVHHVERIGRQHRAERGLPRRSRGRGTDRVEHPGRAELVEQAPGEPGRRQ